MEIVKKYDDFNEIKDDINNYIGLLLNRRELPNINELRSIAKFIILLKSIYTSTTSSSSHYKNSLIFDLLTIMHSLTGNSLRQFHYIYRSFIENYIRSMLNIADDDETGVNELFRRAYDQFGNSKKEIEILNFISAEYGKSCLYVHSNYKAKSNIQLFYNEIITNDDFERRTLSSTINKILLLLKKMTILIIYVNPESIENKFYRRKQQLSYLLGTKIYNLFSEELKKRA